jgi:hypothetical protein
MFRGQSFEKYSGMLGNLVGTFIFIAIPLIILPITYQPSLICKDLFHLRYQVLHRPPTGKDAGIRTRMFYCRRPSKPTLKDIARTAVSFFNNFLPRTRMSGAIGGRGGHTPRGGVWGLP